MTKKIIVAGSVSPGCGLSSPPRAVALAGKEDEVQVTMVAPAPKVAIHPRLYEALPKDMDTDIAALLDARASGTSPG